MIKTLSPYSTAGTSTAKAAEILSRYRPIAPKPETGPVGPAGGGDNSSSPSSCSSLSQKIRESPYLRTLWPQLQSRPTRTRKRGRATISPPLVKRSRTHYFLGLSSPGPVTSPGKHISFQGFGGTGTGQFLPLPNLSGVCGSLQESPVSSVTNLVTLPLLPCSVPSVMSCVRAGKEKFIDLNVTADQIPEEKDLLKQLQESTTTTTIATVVFAPQPIRPVGSCVNVKCISEDPNAKAWVTKKPEEVEEEVEREAMPAIISDSKNIVRLANSAYKEMVGQPECSWLDSMVVAPGRGSCKRICGEVALEFCDPTVVPANSSNGFSCWVRIDWGGGEGKVKKNSVVAYCDVVRLCCDSKDYLFTWRFHTRSREGCSQSRSSY